MNDLTELKNRYRYLNDADKLELIKITANSLNVEYTKLMYKGRIIPNFKQLQRLIIKRS